MNKQEIKELAALVADQVVKKLSDAPILSDQVVKKLGDTPNSSEPEYVDTEEAARILGFKPAYLRQVKDRYPHIKAGDRKQCRIMFKRDALMNQFFNV